MDENQIDLVIYHNLKDKKIFKGTFAANELVPMRRLEPGCTAFVTNTLSRNDVRDMGHWLAIIVKISGKNVNLKFVDSFKMPYSTYGKYISKYIDNLRVKAANANYKFIFEEVPFGLQSVNSLSCGGYAVYSILGYEFKLCKLFSSFSTTNKKSNDRFVEDFVEKKWPKTFCSDIITKSNKVPFCKKKVFKSSNCLLKCFCGKECCFKLRTDYYIRPKVKNIFSVTM